MVGTRAQDARYADLDELFEPTSKRTHEEVRWEEVAGRPKSWGYESRPARSSKPRKSSSLENGEALKYIDSVLRQLQRASRDHQRLLKLRHVDAELRLRDSCSSVRKAPQCGSFKLTEDHRKLVDHGAKLPDRRKVPESSRSDPATRLLSKRKAYLEAALAALDTAQKRIHQRTTIEHRVSRELTSSRSEHEDERLVLMRPLSWHVPGGSSTLVGKCQQPSTVV